MKKYFFRIRSIKKSGDTLLEVLVAIVILVLFLSSIFGMLNRSLVMNENIRSRVIALNLAREGIEGVRNIRDTNWLRFSGDRRNKWLCFTVDADGNCVVSMISGTYRLNFIDETFVLEENLDYQLYQDVNGLYSHDSSGTPSKFSRQINLSLSNAGSPGCTQDVSPPESGCPQKLEVESQVTWNEGDTPEEVVLETHLFDYYQRDAY
jgi:Tfp pilus assembly protein PilV